MRLGALSLMRKTSSRSTLNLAAWHSPHSLVWSWCASISADRIWRKPNGWLRFGIYGGKHNYGGEWMLAFPFIILRWSWQHEKWFKDMYRRKAIECEELERKARWLRRELADTRKGIGLSA